MDKNLDSVKRKINPTKSTETETERLRIKRGKNTSMGGTEILGMVVWVIQIKPPSEHNWKNIKNIFLKESQNQPDSKERPSQILREWRSGKVSQAHGGHSPLRVSSDSGVWLSSSVTPSRDQGTETGVHGPPSQSAWEILLNLGWDSEGVLPPNKEVSSQALHRFSSEPPKSLELDPGVATDSKCLAETHTNALWKKTRPQFIFNFLNLFGTHSIKNNRTYKKTRLYGKNLTSNRILTQSL